MKKITLVLALLIVIGLSIFIAQGLKTDKSRFTLILTGILQGHISPLKQKNSELEQGGVLFLGTRVMAVRKEVLARSEQCLWLDNGDDFSGTPDAYYTQGEAIARIMEKLPIDMLTLGNREFDFGKDVLFNLIKGASFYYSSNVFNSDQSSPENLHQIILKETPEGRKLLVIGLTPPNTPQQTLMKNVEGLVFLDLKSTLARFQEALREADALIVLTQFTRQELIDNVKFLQEYPGKKFLLVYNAFENQEFKLEAFSPDIWFVPVDGISLGRTFVTLEFNLDQGNISGISYKTVEVGVSDIEPDRELSTVVGNYRRQVDSIIQQVIGESSLDLEVDNNQEFALADLVCDVMLRETGAEFAVTNSSGIRVGLKKGKITLENLYQIIPFDNNTVSMKLQGKDIRAIFERNYERKQPILQIAGGKIQIDRNQTPKVKSIQIGGAPLSDERFYKIVTNSFLADGGDGYLEFKNGTERVMGNQIRKSMNDFIKTGSPLKPQTEGRIVITEAAAIK
ncbi:MAG: bifunctional UDP-sugar hydrolase/5'-nucleotidase [Candidatus Wallbacteria bacterium]|nr:bifunctional UDP-sugar hydrolase/5'-nucleotidase [Candidatus Wallbacteria bacterium]